MSPQHLILKHLFLFMIVNKVEIKLTLLGFFFILESQTPSRLSSLQSLELFSYWLCSSHGRNFEIGWRKLALRVDNTFIFPFCYTKYDLIKWLNRNSRITCFSVKLSIMWTILSRTFAEIQELFPIS